MSDPKNGIQCVGCGEIFPSPTDSEDLRENWLCPACMTASEPRWTTPESVSDTALVQTLWSFSCGECAQTLRVYGTRAEVAKELHTCPECSSITSPSEAELLPTEHGRIDCDEVYLFDVASRNDIEGDVHVVPGESLQAAFKKVIRPETTRTNIEKLQETGECNEIRFLGTVDDLESRESEEWLVTGIRSVVIQSGFSRDQQEDLMALIRETMLGDREVICLDPECEGYGPFFGAPEPTDSELTCPECAGQSVLLVDGDEYQ